MCAVVAPFLLPGLAGAGSVSCTVPETAGVLNVASAPAAQRADVEALLRGLDAAVRPPTPAGLAAPLAVPELGAAACNHGVHAAAARGDADAVTTITKTTTFESVPNKKRRLQGWEYDSSIDATLRAMERDPAERPSAVYLRDRQAGEITKADRAELIESMHDFSRFYALALGTLHRAVSYVDRFLSVRKLDGGGGGQMLQNVGAAAVFVAAKYEDQGTLNEIDADDAAELAGSSRREVLAAERELVAALGYRLGGPTAHTFVDHLTRHAEQEEEYEGEVVVVRSLAHHLADMALLEYRCVGSLPSAVAASAIVLARLVLGYEPSSLCGVRAGGPERVRGRDLRHARVHVGVAWLRPVDGGLGGQSVQLLLAPTVHADGPAAYCMDLYKRHVLICSVHYVQCVHFWN